MRPHLPLLLSCCLALAASACQPEARPTPPPTAPPPSVEGEASQATPLLPAQAPSFKPAFAQLEGGELDSAQLNDVARCQPCHAEQVAQWRQSPHALAAFANPWYRTSLSDFTQERGAQKARFCNGCHDVAMTFQADPQPLAPHQAEGFAGVTCATCHSIKAATGNGNASYTLDTSPIPLPVEGDQASLQRHIARVAPPALRSEELCASCHKGFMSPDTGHPVKIQGLNEYAPWRRSAWAGSLADRIDDPALPQKSCNGCHMQEVNGAASHRFPGGHSSLAAALQAPEQLEAIKEMVQSAATVDLQLGHLEQGRWRPLAPSAQPPGDQPLTVDVVIFNQNSGHDFPGGAKDLKDTWVEVRVLDARGETLLASGVEHAETGMEADAHRLRAVMLEHGGQAVYQHQVAKFRAPVFDRTIAPRDAAVARYLLELPQGMSPEQWPLRVEARLRHRRLQRQLYDRVCQESGQPEHQAWRQATTEALGQELDPCQPQPTLEIASASLQFGPGRSQEQDPRPTWQRLLTYGQALAHHNQEHLEEARLVLEQAQQALTPQAPTWARASISLEQARVAGRQGRTEDAERLLEQVAAWQPDHPALWAVRAQSHQQVWRWERAAQAWERVTQLAPRDDRAWSGLALAQGSLGRPQQALLAAQEGLKLESRDPHLLRLQSSALARLRPGSPEAQQAHQAWLDFRRDEEASQIKGRCQDTGSRCQQERVSIFARSLQPPR